ncbi:MAG: PfkB family carbohydrate kinase [Athalassotoga sp.]|uniref:PfkB family carbohydrate kinase n=1 Tax=Athalassotoga sp. TaxID=2022597 RepID=UPI003D075898
MKKVLVIGDLFLDRYFYYDPNYGSPSLETGIRPIVAIRESFAPGAAGNVAKDFALFGADVRIVSAIGDDGNGFELVRALKARKVDTNFLVITSDRPTPVYSKFINTETNKEDLPRVDLLPTESISKKVIDELLQKLNQSLEWADTIVILDQMDDPDLGVITEEVKDLLGKARMKMFKPFFVDSRSRPYAFEGYTIKPNLKEFEKMASHPHLLDAPNLPPQIIVQRYAIKVSQMLRSDLVITASEDGAYVVENGELFRIFSMPVDVVDVTGAGDAFMAAMVVTYLNGRNDLVKSAVIGLKAGNLCVSQHGTGEFDIDDVLKLPDPKVEKVLSEKIFVNHPKNTGKFKFALFDFDGTLSLLREGWQSIMKEMMIEEITGDKNLPEEDFLKIEREIEDYIERTTGQQTILQMMDLEKMVRNYGFVSENKIKTPMEYKKIYNQRLKEVVKERIKNGRLNEYLLKGSYEFLTDLKNHGIKILTASGTDLEDVLEESELLGIKYFFDGGIYGAVGADYKEHTKEMVIKRLIDKNNLNGSELVIFGDGPVEISVGKNFDAFTVGVASDEKKGYGWNLKKFQRLKDVGADLLIPDFTVKVALEKIFLHISKQKEGMK